MNHERCRRLLVLVGPQSLRSKEPRSSKVLLSACVSSLSVRVHRTRCTRHTILPQTRHTTHNTHNTTYAGTRPDSHQQLRCYDGELQPDQGATHTHTSRTPKPAPSIPCLGAVRHSPTAPASILVFNQHSLRTPKSNGETSGIHVLASCVCVTGMRSVGLAVT